jgi:hypothetical protein
MVEDVDDAIAQVCVAKAATFSSSTKTSARLTWQSRPCGRRLLHAGVFVATMDAWAVSIP